MEPLFQRFQPVLEQGRRVLLDAVPSSWPELREQVEVAWPLPSPSLLLLPVAAAVAATGCAGSSNAGAAWGALNLSLRILDDLQDHDRPDGLWAIVGDARAWHAASTLRELCSVVILDADVAAERRLGALQALSRCLMEVGQGQEADLRQQASTAAEGWQIVSAKSGALFQGVCGLGARLAGALPHELAAVERFGRHLGHLLQVLDDVESCTLAAGARDLAAGRRPLPVLFAERLGATLPPAADWRRRAQVLHISGAIGLSWWTAWQEGRRAIEALTDLDPQGRVLLRRYVQAPFPPELIRRFEAMSERSAPADQRAPWRSFPDL